MQITMEQREIKHNKGIMIAMLSNRKQKKKCRRHPSTEKLRKKKSPLLIMTRQLAAVVRHVYSRF
jgi:DNA-binding cell septation regulator SpoVG